MNSLALERDQIAPAAKYEPGRGQVDVIHIQVTLHDERLAPSEKAEVVVSLHRTRTVSDLSYQVYTKLSLQTASILTH